MILLDELMFLLEDDVPELWVEEGEEVHLKVESQVVFAQLLHEGLRQCLEEETPHNRLLGVTSHVAGGDVLKGECLAEDQVAEQPTLCLPGGVWLAGEGGEGPQEGSVEVCLLGEYPSGEEVELQVVHLLLVEQAQQSACLELRLVAQHQLLN